MGYGRRGALVALGLLLVLASPALCQSTEGAEVPSLYFPGHGFMITGYGGASYQATFADGTTPNDFKATLNPVLLWQIGDQFLFESEIEFGLEEGQTETELEYAQIDYSLNDNLKLVAGKFLLPFNIFGERMHPTWINGFVSFPAIYGGHHGGSGPAPPLIPVLNDVGVQARSTFNVGRFGYLTAAAFVSQGPALEEPGADEEPTEPHAHEIPEVVWGTNFEDNNQDKMIGGRVGVGVAPYFEVNLSALTAAYDPEGDLRFSAYGLHGEGRYRDFELHGEWIHTDQDVPDEDTGEVNVLGRDGYWAQLSYRIRKWEPEVRWSQIFESDLEEETATPGGRQLALGVAYWLQPSLAVKAEYLINDEETEVDNDRLAVQWAFGF